MDYPNLNLQSFLFQDVGSFKKSKMDKVNTSKEEMYRAEIFKLLKCSLGELSESELNIIQELFIKDNINEDELLKRIVD
jgi:hypothetical protein